MVAVGVGLRSSWVMWVASSVAASRRWQGLKAVRVPCITPVMKSTMARPSAVSSRMSFASLRRKGLDRRGASSPRSPVSFFIGAMLLMLRPLGVAEVGWGVLDQVLGDEAWGDLVEAPGGGGAVVVPEAVDGSLGDAEVELDDASAIVGDLADDLRHGWRALLYCCYAHAFQYSTGVLGVKGGKWGKWMVDSG